MDLPHILQFVLASIFSTPLAILSIISCLLYGLFIFSELLRIYSQSYYKKYLSEDYKYLLILSKKFHIILKSIRGDFDE
jgi:hypothetical protein